MGEEEKRRRPGFEETSLECEGREGSRRNGGRGGIKEREGWIFFRTRHGSGRRRADQGGAGSVGGGGEEEGEGFMEIAENNLETRVMEMWPKTHKMRHTCPRAEEREIDAMCTPPTAGRGGARGGRESEEETMIVIDNRHSSTKASA